MKFKVGDRVISVNGPPDFKGVIKEVDEADKTYTVHMDGLTRSYSGYTDEELESEESE